MAVTSDPVDGCCHILVLDYVAFDGSDILTQVQQAVSHFVVFVGNENSVSGSCEFLRRKETQ